MIQENFQKKADSLGGNTHAVHTSSYRSHTISSSTGQPNIEYTDEINEFSFDEEKEILDHLNLYKNRDQIIKIRNSDDELCYFHSAVLRYAF